HDAWTRNDLSSASLLLAALRERISHEHELRDLAERVDALFHQIEEKVTVDHALQADRARLLEFSRKRSDAVRFSTQFAGLNLDRTHGGIRRAALAAIQVFGTGASAGSWELAPLPASLQERERTEIAEGCYELLLILADAENAPDDGLRWLDRAARLRPATK